MTDPLRVILEIGKKRRVVAGAMEWPGLDRWGTSEDDALAKLESYLPRYAGVAERAGLAMRSSARSTTRSSSASLARARPTSGASPTCRRDRARGAVIEGPRAPARPAPGHVGLLRRHGGARLRGASLRVRAAAAEPASRSSATTYANEPEQFSRKVEVRTPREVVLTPRGLAAHREAISTRSAPTTPRASRPAPGRSSSSSVAPRST